MLVNRAIAFKNSIKCIPQRSMCVCEWRHEHKSWLHCDFATIGSNNCGAKLHLNQMNHLLKFNIYVAHIRKYHLQSSFGIINIGVKIVWQWNFTWNLRITSMLSYFYLNIAGLNRIERLSRERLTQRTSQLLNRQQLLVMWMINDTHTNIQRGWYGSDCEWTA